MLCGGVACYLSESLEAVYRVWLAFRHFVARRERPSLAARVEVAVHHSVAYDRIQPLHPLHDDGPMCPWTAERYVQVVAVGLCGELCIGVGRDLFAEDGLETNELALIGSVHGGGAVA